MNYNPVVARLAKRDQRAPRGDLAELMAIVWRAVEHLEDTMSAASPPGDICRTAHALAACTNTYAKLFQIGEYEGRFKALEEEVARLRQWPPSQIN